MIEYTTNRLKASTEMEVIDGHLMPPTTSKGNSIDILNLHLTSGRETGFKYVLKTTDEEVCHIGITKKRGKFEISYGTVEAFRRRGYMCEALSSFLDWLKEKTDEKEVWGLPNGPESEHILKKCGFDYYGLVDESKDSKWYVFYIES